jgi:hypothetical protein
LINYNTVISYIYLQPTTIQNSIFSTQRENSIRRSREWKRKQLRSNRNRKQNSKQSVTNNFHHRNMMTVRRISRQDMLDAQIKTNVNVYEFSK